jgi:hypothetical protein
VKDPAHNTDGNLEPSTVTAFHPEPATEGDLHPVQTTKEDLSSPGATERSFHSVLDIKLDQGTDNSVEFYDLSNVSSMISIFCLIRIIYSSFLKSVPILSC